MFELRPPRGVRWIVFSERCGLLGEWNEQGDLGNHVGILAWIQSECEETRKAVEGKLRAG
jgi:hypothetical protein